MALPFERLLTALNSRQFPVFSRPPAQLLNLALKFRVSRRLSISLGEYQKQLAKQQQLEEQKEQEQLQKQQRQAAETAKQQDVPAGQLSSSSTAAKEPLDAGQGHAESGSTSGQPSAAQPMENGHAGPGSAQPPGGSRSGELPDSPQQRGASSTQQLGSAPVDRHVSPFQGARASEPFQAPMLGDSVGSVGSEGRHEALHEAQARHTQASPAHVQQASTAGKGLGQRQEGSGEDDSFTSARSSPAAAVPASDRGFAPRFNPAAGYEGAAGDSPSKQPSLLPRALSTGKPMQSSGASSAPAGRRRSRDQFSKDQGKQGGSLLNFFRSTSKEPDLGLESRGSEHLNGSIK